MPLQRLSSFFFFFLVNFNDCLLNLYISALEISQSIWLVMDLLYWTLCQCELRILLCWKSTFLFALFIWFLLSFFFMTKSYQKNSFSHGALNFYPLKAGSYGVFFISKEYGEKESTKRTITPPIDFFFIFLLI